MGDTGHQIWICADCLQLHANGDEELENYYGPDATNPDADRLAQILAQSCVPGGWAVTLGMLRSEHDALTEQQGDDGCYIGEEWQGQECPYEEIGFSWSPCGACGSPLGGSRDAAVIWEPTAAQ